MMKRIISILAVIALIASFALIPASAATTPNDARESVAVVMTCLELDDGMMLPIATGSCFFVGEKGKDPSNMVTNHHVISDYLDYGAGQQIELTVYGQAYTGRTQIRIYYDSASYDEAFPVEYDELKDIAILKLASPTDRRKPIALHHTDDSMVGSNVYTIGYPGIADNDYNKAISSWEISSSTVTTGTVSRLLTLSGTGVNLVQTDCTINHGNSGGPIVTENGAAIAIASSFVAQMYSSELDTATVYYGINVSDVTPILDRNSIKWYTDTPTVNWVLIIIIAAAVIVLAGVAVLIIVLVSSNKKKAAAAQQAAAAQAQAEQKAKEANVKYPYLRSYAVQHNGKRIVIRDQQIFIGRNVNVCAVVFQEGTPGVSGRHCSLAYNGATGDFILTDLNSSYGTYLADGTKLNPGVPYHLRAGDRFYLGDKENMMGVELE